VPLTHPAPHPVIAAALAAGVPLTCDIELFAAEAAPRPILAVTGTNGKSTTTALVHHLLETAGRPALLGGNIGRPVFDLALGPVDQALVLELSSFQLDLCQTFHPQIAGWLNLTPDHLDRHGNLAGYIAAKRRIFANQTSADVAVVAVDDEPSAAIAADLDGIGRTVVRVAVGHALEDGVFVVDGRLHEAHAGRPTIVADLRRLPALLGIHNHQNAALAYAMVRAFGLDESAALRGLADFPGLAHRIETVGQVGRVRFVNDSKATNPVAAAKSLTCFDAIWWIAGGRPKPGGFADLLPALGAVRGAFLIGEAAGALEIALDGRVPVEQAGTLDRAVELAHRAARASDAVAPVVLLAPACASFDQFTSYEARGEAFRARVRELAAAERGAA
jgi:UDP-N-acetylmuramoylalanine--D-glutamate ligase